MLDGDVGINHSPALSGQQVVHMAGYQPGSWGTDDTDAFLFQGPFGGKGLMVQKYLVGHVGRQSVNDSHFHVSRLYPCRDFKGGGQRVVQAVSEQGDGIG